ncbi:MAG: hypothetical protein R2867_38995 [Caldilineaceae bacterium]
MIQAMDVGIAAVGRLAQQGLTENTIVLFSSDNGPAFMLVPTRCRRE